MAPSERSRRTVAIPVIELVGVIVTRVAEGVAVPDGVIVELAVGVADGVGEVDRVVVGVAGTTPHDTPTETLTPLGSWPTGTPTSA